jgi:hypothetical protein
MEQCRTWELPHPVRRRTGAIVSIEDFKTEITNSRPTKDSRPLRDIDMTKRSEKQDPTSPKSPDSEGDVVSSD